MTTGMDDAEVFTHDDGREVAVDEWEDDGCSACVQHREDLADDYALDMVEL